MPATDPTSRRYAGGAIDALPTLFDGLVKLVRTGLDITALGVQIMDVPPSRLRPHTGLA